MKFSLAKITEASRHPPYPNKSMGRNNYGKPFGFGIAAAALAVPRLSPISSFMSELADLQRTNYSSPKASFSQFWIILV